MEPTGNHEPSSFPRRRARSLGMAPGILQPGPINAITDVAGVLVGHTTLVEGEDVRTGVTAVLPHLDNPFQYKVPAGLAVGNAYGKLIGATQIVELGEIETPIVLTNTLGVAAAAQGIVEWTLAQPGNEHVFSVNPVAGETNDSLLNDIRTLHITPALVRQTIEAAQDGLPEEGAAGAGTGTCAFGWKAGIGTSSRRLPGALGGYTVGTLVQSNFGGVLQICGVPVGQALGRYYLKDELEKEAAGESIMILLATDAPLSDRNLARLARRAFVGLSRTGASMTHFSGDYAIAFSTAEAVRRTPARRSELSTAQTLPNDLVSPLFQAAAEAVEEAIYNSLFMADTMRGFRGRVVEALPLQEVIEIFRQRQPGSRP